MTWNIPHTLHVCSHMCGACTLFLEIFITIHHPALWPSRWPTGSIQHELKIPPSSLPVPEGAVWSSCPPSSTAAMHCLDLYSIQSSGSSSAYLLHGHNQSSTVYAERGLSMQKFKYHHQKVIWKNKKYLPGETCWSQFSGLRRQQIGLWKNLVIKIKYILY